MGKQTFLISSENIRLPRGITPLDVVPPDDDLFLLEPFEKQMPIIPQLVGELPNGFRIQSVKRNPNSVQGLTPPDVQGLETVMTTPIHFESLDDGVVMDFKIITPSVLLPVDKR